MSIQYTYKIVNVDEAARCMEVVYTSEGHQTMHIGARLPYEGESLESVIAMYSPVALWLEQAATVVVPNVGASGAMGAEPMQTLESTKAEKLAQIAQWRYEREVSGVSADGATISTDRESQAKLSAAFSSLNAGLLTSINWKTQGGSFIVLNSQNIGSVAGSVAQHVQSCFDAEMALAQQVNAAESIEAVNAVVVA